MAPPARCESLLLLLVYSTVADLGIYKGGFQFRRWKYILT